MIGTNKALDKIFYANAPFFSRAFDEFTSLVFWTPIESLNGFQAFVDSLNKAQLTDMVTELTKVIELFDESMMKGPMDNSKVFLLYLNEVQNYKGMIQHLIDVSGKSDH